MVLGEKVPSITNWEGFDPVALSAIKRINREAIDFRIAEVMTEVVNNGFYDCLVTKIFVPVMSENRDTRAPPPGCGVYLWA
jgi:hypothetical protein